MTNTIDPQIGDHTMDQSISVVLSDSKLTREQILQFHHAWGKTKLTGSETIYRATARARVEYVGKPDGMTDLDVLNACHERVFTHYSTTAVHARAAALDSAFAWAKELTS